jgi:DNA helicase-2/ATP-dependent DNA helicase PcrA
MTSRIGKPDTDADQQLHSCLNQWPLRCFVMVAGAGSGKTTSLVKALDHLARSKGSDLRRRGQQIACITYTKVAVSEIWGDVGNAPLFHVSTIHSFLWTVVRPFQSDLRNWVDGRINKKIAAAQERLAKPLTRANTREQLGRDIERYRAQLTSLPNVKCFTYSTGSDYAKGILGDGDILNIGSTLIADQPLLRKLIAGRFPYLFVDESQDTNPDIVNAFKQIAETVSDRFCLGFFGDPMQKIYTTGAGQITIDEGWEEITKPENFRCPASVLRVINRIRAEDDGLKQVRGRTIEHDGIIKHVEGTARLFIVPADTRRSEHLTEVRRRLSRMNADPLWERDDGDVRVLVLVHRMAAQHLGFINIYAALNDHSVTSLKDGLLDGTAWVLRPFIAYLLPLVLAARAGNDFDVIAILKNNCALLDNKLFLEQNASDLLIRLKNDVEHLVKMFNSELNHSIRDVLTFVHNQELINLDERFIRFITEPVSGDDESDSENAAVLAFLASPAAQLWGYRTYIEDQSLFATQQGIKGAEFQRVLVVLDDEESDYNQFSYGKYFGITALSEKDQKNISNGVDSVISRTRRLFYVCCSRAVQDLAVVLFASDVYEANDAIIAMGLFDQKNVHVFESLDSSLDNQFTNSILKDRDP